MRWQLLVSVCMALDKYISSAHTDIFISSLLSSAFVYNSTVRATDVLKKDMLWGKQGPLCLLTNNTNRCTCGHKRTCINKYMHAPSHTQKTHILYAWPPTACDHIACFVLFYRLHFFYNSYFWNLLHTYTVTVHIDLTKYFSICLLPLCNKHIKAISAGGSYQFAMCADVQVSCFVFHQWPE